MYLQPSNTAFVSALHVSLVAKEQGLKFAGNAQPKQRSPTKDTQKTQKKRNGDS